MNGLFEKCIDWDKLGNIDRTGLTCDVEDAFIMRDESTLMMRVSLNFVVPISDELKIKSAIRKSTSEDLKVKIFYEYDSEDFQIDNERTISLIVERYLADKSNSMIKSAKCDKLSLCGDEVRILCLGK